MAATPTDPPHGYLYGDATVPKSPVTLEDLAQLKITVGLTADHERYLSLAGDVLADQVKQVVEHWRSGIIAGIPHLARHSRSPDNSPLPAYLAASNLRFQQWILDTCRRPYDQDWLNYQNEIALRHTTIKKNQTDHVDSTPFVPFRDVIGFVPVMNKTIKPFLAAKGHSAEDVDRMHDAWCRSLQLQIAIWGRTYMALNSAESQW